MHLAVSLVPNGGKHATEGPIIIHRWDPRNRTSISDIRTSILIYFSVDVHLSDYFTGTLKFVIEVLTGSTVCIQ